MSNFEASKGHSKTLKPNTSSTNDEERRTNFDSTNPYEATIGPLPNRQELEWWRATIDHHLQQFTDHHRSDPLHPVIAHGLLAPGKRIRPLVTLFACAQSGGTPDSAIPAACAVEMVHTASLIMDDLPAMDNASMRRGQETTHILFGDDATLLACVAMMNEAYRMILSAPNGGNSAAKLNSIDHLASAIGLNGLTSGQARDLGIKGDIKGAPEPVTDLEQCHEEKTGALFAAAAAIGGEIAGADPIAIKQLKQYGICLGLAYQALDDVIDLTSTKMRAGKDVTQDDKKTSITSHASVEQAMGIAHCRLEEARNLATKAATERPQLATLTDFIAQSLRSLAIL